MTKALIFDVDGTLAETEELGHRVAFNYAFQHMGFSDYWSQSDYKQLLKIDGGKERIQHYWRSTQHPDAENTKLICRIHQQKTAFYQEIVERGTIELRPGVEDLIKSAVSNDIRLAIATTTSYANIANLLGSLGNSITLDCFDFIACAENVPKKKPAPDVYLLALKELGLSADQVIAFEDNQNGLFAANAAGIEKVVVAPTFLNKGENFSSAWQELSDLREFSFEPEAMLA